MIHLFERLFRSTSAVEVEKSLAKKAPSIILIHGANASPTSFNYIKTKLPDAEYHIIHYSVANDFSLNLEQMLSDLDSSKDYHILSHSMGGLYALHLSQHISVKSSISVSTPFGGVASADWGKYMLPSYQLFRDVSTQSKPITSLRHLKLDMPWKQIITTRGNVPWLKKPNDSVVTVESMKARSDMEHIYIDESHNEVLLSDELVEIVRKDFFFS